MNSNSSIIHTGCWNWPLDISSTSLWGFIRCLLWKLGTVPATCRWSRTSDKRLLYLIRINSPWQITYTINLIFYLLLPSQRFSRLPIYLSLFSSLAPLPPNSSLVISSTLPLLPLLASFSLISIPLLVNPFLESDLLSCLFSRFLLIFAGTGRGLRRFDIVDVVWFAFVCVFVFWCWDFGAIMMCKSRGPWNLSSR